MDPIAITLLVLLGATVMFVWEKLPIAITAMAATTILCVTGVLTPKQAFSGFADSNVVLFGAMFIVGGALFETGMANKIGTLVTRFAKTERQLIVSIMTVTGLLSAVLSNTGTAAILMPVVIGIAAKSGFSKARLLMPMVFASAIGGNITLIGAPGNMIADSALKQMGNGNHFAFFEFAKIGIPMLIVGVAYFVMFGYKLLPKVTKATEVVKQNEDYSHIPEWKKYTSLAVMLATVAGMIFEKEIGIPLYVTGVVGAIVLVATKTMTEKQAFESIDLGTIFLFAGMLPVAIALEKTGAGTVIATTVIGFLGSDPSPMLMLIVLFTISCVLTQFMSNTATTALIAPIAVSISQAMGADPRAVLMAIVVGGSCAYATPIGMPANTMVYGPGGYKFLDYTKAGLPLIIVSFIVSVVLLPMFWPFFPGK